MAYLESICKAGRTQMHNLYYSIRYNDGGLIGEKRGKKSKPTTEQQREINRKIAERNLTRILNANFGKDDWYVTYSFAKDKRPGSPEVFRGIVKKFLRALRKAYKAAGVPFRYVWVAEIGERGAAHVHMVQSGIGLEHIRRLWNYGYMTVKSMDPSGSYWRLANYFIKYSDKTMRTEGRLQGKRYNCSKNLRHPAPEKTRIRKRRKFDVNNIRVPEGWYLEQDTVESGVDANGYEYLRYTLVMLPGYIGCKKQRKGQPGRKQKLPGKAAE